MKMMLGGLTFYVTGKQSNAKYATMGVDQAFRSK